MTTLRKLFRTTTFRTAAVLAVLFALAAALTIVYVYANTSAFFEDRVRETLLAETLGLAEQYRTGGISSLTKSVERRVLMPGNSIYLVTDADGGWVAGNVRNLTRELWEQEGRVAFEYARPHPDGAQQRHALAYIYPVGQRYRLMVGRDVEDQRELVTVFRTAALSGLTFMVLVGLGGGLLVSRNLLRRIDVVSETSRVIMRGDLSGRVPLDGSGDEIDRLSVNLNAMLERIEQLMNGLREVSDNIAHDLKTPLNRLRSRVETTLREGDAASFRPALERTIEEADELIRIFNALLSIARLEAGSNCGAFSELDARDVLRDVAELYEPLAEQEGVAFELIAGEPIRFMGDRHLIGQAVANLLDNAIKYGRAVDAGSGGSITLWAEHVGNDCHILVADTGPGIVEAERAHAVKRFGRLEKSRSQPGTGLGLSLVTAVARLHGGELMLEDNAPGLRCRLRLPASAAPGSPGSDDNRSRD